MNFIFIDVLFVFQVSGSVALYRLEGSVPDSEATF
jgi:hypothetical protein